MQQVRAKLERRRSATAQPSNTPPRSAHKDASPSPAGPECRLKHELLTYDLSLLRTEVEGALEGQKLVGQVNPRPPGIHNRAIQLVKRAMARSLTWYTRPLHHFQSAVIRGLQQIVVVLNQHNNSLQKLGQEVESQTSRIEQFRESAVRQVEVAISAVAVSDQRITALGASHSEQVAVIAAQIEHLRAELGRLGNELGVNRSEVGEVKLELEEARIDGRARDRDLRRYLHDIQVNQPASSERGPSRPRSDSVPTLPMFPSDLERESDFDYFLFEERYRGDESLITRRQNEYLEYFRGRQNVVDIGCGRGEFLELMRSNGITAKGVELGTDQYLLCREKNLDVVQGDLFEFLESVPDGTLGGLFSAQVIEHLSAGDQLRFVRLAHQKTSAGSPVIFETINAQCVFAVMRNFFIDPTHIRPVHPETLKFAMESVRFHGVELRFSSPMSEGRIPPLKLNGDSPQLAEFNRAIEGVNELLFGYMDYAAIGWR